jgi:hypothetical protein
VDRKSYPASYPSSPLKYYFHPDKIQDSRYLFPHNGLQKWDYAQVFKEIDVQQLSFTRPSPLYPEMPNYDQAQKVLEPDECRAAGRVGL